MRSSSFLDLDAEPSAPSEIEQLPTTRERAGHARGAEAVPMPHAAQPADAIATMAVEGAGVSHSFRRGAPEAQNSLQGKPWKELRNLITHPTNGLPPVMLTGEPHPLLTATAAELQ